MNEIVAKRKLSDSARAIVKNREPDMAAVAGVIDSLGTLLSLWTGESVRVTLSAKGQSEGRSTGFRTARLVLYR